MQLVFYIIYIMHMVIFTSIYHLPAKLWYFSNLKTGSLLVGRAATEALTTWLLESSGGCTRICQIRYQNSLITAFDGKNTKHHLKNIKSLWLTRTLSAGKLSCQESYCAHGRRFAPAGNSGKNTEVVYQAGSFQRRQLEPQTSTLW